VTPVPESFVTDRLAAHRVTDADEPFLAAMFADPQVHATLGGPRDAARIREMLDRMLANWERSGYGTWILEDRSTGAPVGWVGLHDTETGGPGGVELLYAITSDRWREGLATEAGRAVVDFARESLDHDELVCFTLVDNVGSQRTMRGLGFQEAGEVEHAGLPHVLTRLPLTRSDRPQEQGVGDRG
jgi:[ribosomal protein S5]-alanine N-acetyltransferase